MPISLTNRHHIHQGDSIAHCTNQEKKRVDIARDSAEHTFTLAWSEQQIDVHQNGNCNKLKVIQSPSNTVSHFALWQPTNLWIIPYQRWHEFKEIRMRWMMSTQDISNCFLKIQSHHFNIIVLLKIEILAQKTTSRHAATVPFLRNNDKQKANFLHKYAAPHAENTFN